MTIRLASVNANTFTVSASVNYTAISVAASGLLASAAEEPRLIFGAGGGVPEVLPQTNLPTEQVIVGDGDDGNPNSLSLALTKALDVFKEEPDDVALPSDAIDRFDVELVKEDSVTVVETRVKVFTDFIDFDPSDADVDATPVTMSDADAKDITVGELADNDDVTVSEAVSNQPDIPKTDAITTTEAIDQFRPHKNVTDTATASEAINRFDVTTEFDDTVTATEALAKDFTQISTDDVTAVQSNVKAFTSNVDFDLSDADVDPDPVTASDAIDDFDVSKGITDTATATESAAKNFTHGGFTDTATATESAAKNLTHGGFTDILTAVEGIKLNPELPFGHAVSATEAKIFTIQPVLSETATATESISTTLTLGDLTFMYPDYVTVSDGYIGGFIEEHYSYTISSTEYFVPNTGVIGAAETLNTVIMAADRVTAPDESSSGLVVNFHYTDVDEDDRALGGYQFNQTPLNPGNSTVGQRAIL